MVSPAGDWFFSILDFVRMILLLALPCLVSMVVIRLFRQKIASALKRGWLSSTLLALFLFLLVVVFAAYFFPWYQGVEEFRRSGGLMPEYLLPTPTEELQIYWIALVRIVSTALVLSFLVLPLVFIAAYAFDAINQRKIPRPVVFGGAALVTSACALVFLMLFPFLITGLFYLLYWGG